MVRRFMRLEGLFGAGREGVPTTAGRCAADSREVRGLFGSYVIALMTIGAFGAPVRANTSSPVIVGFSKNSSSQPRYSTWNGSAWGSSASLSSFGNEAVWVVVRDCPTRNEIALAALDYDKDVNISFFNGSSFGSPTEVCSDTDQYGDRSFDMAYEAASGDLLLTYWAKTNSKVGYRTYNGSTLSSQSLLTLPSTTKVRFIRLVARPQSDEIMLLAMNDDKKLYAASWNGTTFGSVTTLESDSETDSDEAFSFAFETTSGHGLVVYGQEDENQPRYRTWIGGAWSSEMSMPSIGSKMKWARLAADPASDTILFGSLDDAKDINVNVWNGSAWGSNQELETNVPNKDRREFDIAFENGGGEALIVYAEGSANHLHYRTYVGGAWSSEYDSANVADIPQFIALTTGTVVGEIFVACSNLDDDLRIARWTGSSMTSATLIESSLGGENSTEQFMVSVPSSPPLVPADIPYFTDFEGTVGPEWNPTTVSSNATYTKFAGRYRTSPLKLALNTVVGQTYSLTFDFYAIDSWDGTQAGAGSAPDYFIISANGASIFNYSFTHEWPAQGATYPYPYDQIGYYGYVVGWKDAVYRKVQAVFTAADSVTYLNFTGSLTDEDHLGFNDESWGIDNVSVQTARFVDVSAAKSFNVLTSTSADSYGGGILWADLDNDGRLDALLTGNTAKRMLFNIGTGVFNSSTLGAGDVRRQGALVDIDNDGDVDFFSPCVGDNNTARFFLNNGSGTLTDSGNLGFSNATNNEAVAAADVNGDGYCDVIAFSGNGNWIAHHQGGTTPALVGTNASSYGMNGLGDYSDGDYCSSGDVNNDGRPDFFYHYNNGKLFVSNGDGTYTSNNYGISVVTGATKKFGSVWADYDNDGDLDLFCARVDETCTGYLWRNDRDWTAGAGYFTNVTGSAGFNLNTVIDYTPDKPGTRSAAWGDYDNDGYLDLLLVGAGGANYLYKNQGNGTFVRMGEGLPCSGNFIDGVFVDYDNDGDLDIVLTRENGTTVLLENRTNNSNYLKVRVIGRGQGGSNAVAVGTRVELWSGDGLTRLGRRDVGVAHGFGGVEPLWLHFGGVNPNSTYKVKVYFASRAINDPLEFTVTPANASTTIGGTTIPQMLTAQEPNKVKIIQWWEVRNKAP